MKNVKTNNSISQNVTFDFFFFVGVFRRLYIFQCDIDENMQQFWMHSSLRTIKIIKRTEFHHFTLPAEFQDRNY